MKHLISSLCLTLLALAADASTLKSHYGHYYATSGSDTPSGTGNDVAKLCAKKGVTGINWRVNWGDYETTDGGYVYPNDFDRVLSTIGGLGPPSGGAPNNQCKVWLFVQFKVFTTGNPCPSWLKDTAGNPGIAPTNASTSIIKIAAGAASVANSGGGGSDIQVTTSGPHNLNTGDSIFIDNVAGNTNANGTWTITKVSTTAFTLNGRTSNGTRVQSGSPSDWYGRVTNGGGFICKLWDTTVLGKFNAMLAELGSHYDGNALVEGYQIEESSVSTNGAYDDTPSSGGDYDGVAWTNSIISMINHCGSNFPTSRCMAFLNFIQGNQVGLHAVSDALSLLPSNQGCYSGPDILPGSAQLYNGLNQTYQVLIRHVGCRSDSAQNTTIVGSPAGPAACGSDCKAIFQFAVQGTFGHLGLSKPLPPGDGLCINSYIFWNDTVPEQAKVDPAVQAFPYGVQWYGQCSCGGGPP